jgi:hypothetical protein
VNRSGSLWENEFYKIEFLGAECVSGHNVNIKVAVTVKKETTFDVEVDHNDFKVYYLNNMYDSSRKALTDTNYELFISGGTTFNAGDTGVSILTLSCELSNSGFKDSMYELTWNAYSLAKFRPYQHLTII